MVTILHGDNIVASRNELNRLKGAAKGKEIRDINGKNLDEASLRQAVESSSLFGDTLCIVIEQLFTNLGRKEKLIKLYASILMDASKQNEIILWESKELGKTAVSLFPANCIKFFKLPAVIFQFLDALRPQNQKNLLTIFDGLVNTEAPELVLYMIESRVRQLIEVKDGVMPNKMSPWQQSRLTNQGKSFTMDKLLVMHQQLIDLEYSFKTGTAPFTLSQLITQFVLDL
ncbi:hypothetical protein MUP56_00630 [Patescibacteria group bacterium]|nr:hypothetical protein [Patescibacteria group bacterium]